MSTNQNISKKKKLVISPKLIDMKLKLNQALTRLPCVDNFNFFDGVAISM